MHNYDKVVASSSLVRVAGRLHRGGVVIDVFFNINVNLFKLEYMELKVSVINLMLDNILALTDEHKFQKI